MRSDMGCVNEQEGETAVPSVLRSWTDSVGGGGDRQGPSLPSRFTQKTSEMADCRLRKQGERDERRSLIYLP